MFSSDLFTYSVILFSCLTNLWLEFTFKTLYLESFLAQIWFFYFGVRCYSCMKLVKLPDTTRFCAVLCCSELLIIMDWRSSTISVRFVVFVAVSGRLLCLTTIFDYLSHRNSCLQWFLFCAYMSWSLAISAFKVNSNSDTFRGLAPTTRTEFFEVLLFYSTVLFDASSNIA